MQPIKDNSIIQTLKFLQKQFGLNSFQIEDYWTADMCAIGITDRTGKYLLYLSTNRKKRDIFHIEVEDKMNPQTTKVVFADAPHKQMQEVFKNYFLPETMQDNSHNSSLLQ